MRRDGRQDTAVERQQRAVSARAAARVAGDDEASPGAVLGVAAGARRALDVGVEVEQQAQALGARVHQLAVQRQLEPVDSSSVRAYASTSQLVRRLHR